jgi:hypothetical protein
VGDAPTIADLSCCSYLYYPEPFGFDRADWPHIDRWLDRIAALPGWKHPYDLMPGSPVRPGLKEDDHDRRLYLRRHPHPARQGPPRRRLHEVTAVRLSAQVLNALADAQRADRATRSRM